MMMERVKAVIEWQETVTFLAKLKITAFLAREAFTIIQNHKGKERMTLLNNVGSVI